MAAAVVVFDFDKTIIDCDSDNWVIDELGGTQRFDQLLETLPWNTAMDTIMREFHAQGRTIEEIAERLKNAPLPAETVAAIKSAYSFGCDLRIVSDANRFFIETILKHHGLMGYFSEINTNPGYVDEEGRLRILPYHDFSGSSHGCSLCPPNMCKDLGDGKGDYCPSLRLGAQDFVMPRKKFPLWELIAENPHALRAEIREWSDAEEQERVLLRIVDGLELAERRNAGHLFSADCKLQSLPAALPKALRVPN